MKGILVDIKRKDGRMYRRYDYSVLKQEFLKGPYKSLEEFKRAKGMPPAGKSIHLMRKMKGWMDEKRALNQKALANATQQILEEKVIDERKEKLNEYNVGKYLISKGVLALKDLIPTTTEEARKLISTGTELVNNAMGTGKKQEGGVPHLTQVNVNFPKTKFDEMLNELEYPELLRLIAEVKRERDRRGVPASDGKSESEVESGGNEQVSNMGQGSVG